MGIDLNKYLTGRDLQTFQKFGVDRLAQGANLKYKDSIYRVECVETKIELSQGQSVEVLATRIYSKITMSFTIFRLKPNKKQSIETNKDVTIEGNKGLPFHTTILDHGTSVDSNEAPVFQREMTGLETQISNYLKFKQPKDQENNEDIEGVDDPKGPSQDEGGEKIDTPDAEKKAPVEKEKSGKPEKDQPLPQWSKREKAMVFLAGFVALSAIAYGTHRKGILPTRKDIGEFLSQKKKSLSEMWQSWRKKPEATT